MKKIFGVLICLMMIAGFAAAEQEVVLPGGRYAVDVPDWMEYNDPVDGESGMDAYISEDLEMDYTAYPKDNADMLEAPKTLKEKAELLRDSGIKVTIRKVNGIEMLCFRMEDEDDGTPGIGYVFEDGEWIIEIDFWYATQDAGDETKKIMETIRSTEQ